MVFGTGLEPANSRLERAEDRPLLLPEHVTDNRLAPVRCGVLCQYLYRNFLFTPAIRVFGAPSQTLTTIRPA